MAYQRQNNQQYNNRGGGRPQGGYRGQEGFQRQGWDSIHQQMFDALLSHPKMSQRTGDFLRDLQATREPTNNMKCQVLRSYAEWFHRPNKEMVIRPFEDNGNFPSGQQQQQTSQQPRRENAPANNAKPTTRQQPPQQPRANDDQQNGNDAAPWLDNGDNADTPY